MKTLIENAKNEIVKLNGEFGYVAGDLDIAAGIWHGYLSVEQRLKIMKANGIKSLRDAYITIAEMMK